MATTLHLFPELPAELRASIWRFALQNEKVHCDAQAGRAIQLLNYDPSAGTIAAAVSIPYPVLFTVNREARYEAAKQNGCEWMTVHARYRGCEGTSTYPSFKICINFHRDLIYVPKSFLKLQHRNAWVGVNRTPEQYHLQTLVRLLDSEATRNVQHISVSTPVIGLYRIGDWRMYDHRVGPWWKGEGLELFHAGSLKSVHVFSMKRGHVEWAKSQVENYLRYNWGGVDFGERNMPTVTITRP
jgi:hypothetical protein